MFNLEGDCKKNECRRKSRAFVGILTMFRSYKKLALMLFLVRINFHKISALPSILK
jgi:hypothetical protein